MLWHEVIPYINSRPDLVAISEQGRIKYLLFYRRNVGIVLREVDAWYTTEFPQNKIADQMKHAEGFDLNFQFRIEDSKDWKKEIYRPANKVRH